VQRLVLTVILVTAAALALGVIYCRASESHAVWCCLKRPQQQLDPRRSDYRTWSCPEGG
jgi:hypothetical protein